MSSALAIGVEIIVTTGILAGSAGLVVDVQNGALLVETLDGKRHWFGSADLRARETR